MNFGSPVCIFVQAEFFGIKNNDILIVHDDIELAFGTVKQQIGGGMGGHNGLRSVKQHLNTDKFRRMRIGIGRPERMDVASWVTGRFSPEEESKLHNIFSKAYGTNSQPGTFLP